MEIVPKVTIRIDGEEFNGLWDCPGCGAENIVFLPECRNMSDARKELKSMRIEQVRCDTCLRKFERT